MVNIIKCYSLNLIYPTHHHVISIQRITRYWLTTLPHIYSKQRLFLSNTTKNTENDVLHFFYSFALAIQRVWIMKTYFLSTVKSNKRTVFFVTEIQGRIKYSYNQKFSWIYLAEDFESLTLILYKISIIYKIIIYNRLYLIITGGS